MASKLTVTKVQSTVGGSPEFSLPTTDGEDGYFMKTNGSGALSFTNSVPNGGGRVAQIVHSEETSMLYATSNITIPQDDSKPQITEGLQCLSVNITPIDVNNILVVDANVCLSTNASRITAALFDGNTDAIAVASEYGTSAPFSIPIRYVMVAGTTSTINFTVRAGGAPSPTALTVNGYGGSRQYGGSAQTNITVTEYSVGVGGGAAFPTEPLGDNAITGLEFNLAAGDTDHDITIAIGSCRDSTNTENLALTSAITKRIDASWSVGTGNGGLDGSEAVAGTPDADTLYAIWLIKRSDTGVVDVCFSESMTTPSIDGTPIPTAYDYYRFIGYVWIDSSNNIKPFDMAKDVVWFRTASESIALSSASSNFSSWAAAGNPVDLSNYLPVGHYSEVVFGAQATGSPCYLVLSHDATNTLGKVGGSSSGNGDNQQDAWTYPSNSYLHQFIPIMNDQIYLYDAASSTTLQLLIHAVRLKHRT